MRFRGFHLALAFAGVLRAQDAAPDGAAIYAKHCASCHGEHGEGVEAEGVEPLRGERSVESLARYIDKRMPEDEPELVVGEEARRVAEYIHGAFYFRKPEGAAKPAFARLTNRQFRESTADLIGSFGNVHAPGAGTGLKGRYFQSEGMNKKAREAMEREDARLDFDFGEGSPAEGIAADQFSIEWEGSLLAPETGWYEFRLSTPNGARFYLNGDRQAGDGNHRDDSSAKRQTALIDEWVSSGTEVRQGEGRAFLAGGRSYPLRVDYFKYKDPRGSVRVEWKAPGGEWEVLAAPYLSPAPATRVFVVTTAFPADDASEGYERGTGISKEWHEATTKAAVEAANEVVARLELLSGVKEDAPDRAARLEAFVADFAGRAFRRPLDEEQRRQYAGRWFGQELPPEQAVKRAVIFILKSPRFLYPELPGERDGFATASRLALGMWDSIPDRELLEAAKSGKLETAEEVEAQARRMLADARTKAKLAEFFRHWLKMDGGVELRKDAEAFPGFDAALAADLRTSLALFVERVVWSEKSSYRELMEADYLMLNRRLAAYYGAPPPEGDGFQPVACEPAQRSGVLTHPYVLSRLAHHDITSPIHRGVFVTRNLLGGVLRPPPEAVAFENHRFDPGMTMREKVAEMTKATSCMTCHETINPLGFSLENFDATGRFRTSEGGRAIDARSEFLTTEGVMVELGGPRDIAALVVGSDAARRGFVRQLLQFSIKQNPAVFGAGAVERLERGFAESGENVKELFVKTNLLAATRETPDDGQASR